VVHWGFIGIGAMAVLMLIISYKDLNKMFPDPGASRVATTEQSRDRKRAEAEAKQRADEEAEAKAEEDRKRAEAEAKQRADVAARPDPALSMKPSSGKAFQDRLADGTPCPMCPEMVVVPAGEFLMGSTPSEVAALTKKLGPNWEREALQHKVTIPRAFAVGSFAVTFAEWDACVADRGCNGYQPKDEGWGRDKQPVINVNWNDAKAYAAWLSRKTGRTYRLLSEAEREYATRAGTTAAFWWGPSISTSQANYNSTLTFAGGTGGRYRGKTVPVDSFASNPWGLYNVHGNVSEWAEDCWHDSYQGAPTDGSAWTTLCTDGSRRVVRGGSWNSYSPDLRAALGLRSPTGSRGSSIGFRLARTLNP
jgi:formylglycine-generating enzyme required for sulfatase activity